MSDERQWVEWALSIGKSDCQKFLLSLTYIMSRLRYAKGEVGYKLLGAPARDGRASAQ